MIAVGQHVFVRTIGEILIGRLVAETPQGLVLSHATWLAEVGQIHLTLRDGLDRRHVSQNDPALEWSCLTDGSEGDPIWVGRGVISYYKRWPHALPLPDGGWMQPSGLVGGGR